MKLGCTAVALAIALAAGCGDNYPTCEMSGEVADAYQLAADGITAEITTHPLQLRVLDGTGAVMLETVDGSDGYAPAAWTTGNVRIRAYPTPGYFTFDAALDPWRALEVVGAEQPSAVELVLHLRERGASGCASTTMRYAVSASKLRVEASVEGTTPRAWSAAFATPPDEGFLGFGERFNRTNQRGHAPFSWTEESGIGAGEGTSPSRDNPFPSGETMTNYPVPFFLSTRGYAFWLDTTWRSQFELATEREDAWRVWHVGPTLAYEVYTRRPGDARPWPYQLIDAFTATTGRPMVPPAWAYGPRRRISPPDLVDGMPEAQVMRDEDLAITSIDDAVHFYPNGSHVGNEASLAAWVSGARALGYRVNGYYNSMINNDPASPLAPRAEEGLAGGYFLADAAGAFPFIYILTGGQLIELFVVDFTSPAASAWYTQSLAWAQELGYSGWMYDFGEYVQPEVVAANGMTGEELHNLYPVLYAKAAHDFTQASGRPDDWNIFMRSGYTGSSAFVPVAWSGDPAASFEDADGLPSVVRGGINIGISGVPNYGGDIGGYHCIKDGAAAADGELLARWIQQGALSPIMQDQSSCVGGDAGAKANLWRSTDARAAWFTYARLHTRLAPYLYTLGKQANETGAPIMRHVFLEHPDRLDLASEDTAYYLGPALYIAPVLARGARTKTVTLPAGWYLDWQAQALLEGGTTHTLDAPLDKLPILLRAGHLVPLLDPTIDTLAEESSPDIVSVADVADVYDVVGLLVTGEAAASFTLHDDGGLQATADGSTAPSTLDQVNNDNQLASCTSCWRKTVIDARLSRVQITAGDGTWSAGGVTVTSSTGRKVRWDLYVVGE
ncbi:MAG TPA: TIM-barrel domain-containing protein [Kofleriaceae bacterium]|nr:TIM-barrel domain-containing protein [Kofleriaceae bacterium]